MLELVELMSPKDKSKASSEELEGRQSGSSAWRMARGEMGMGVEKMGGNVWKLTQAEKEAKYVYI